MRLKWRRNARRANEVPIYGIGTDIALSAYRTGRNIQQAGRCKATHRNAAGLNVEGVNNVVMDLDHMGDRAPRMTTRTAAIAVERWSTDRLQKIDHF